MDVECQKVKSCHLATKKSFYYNFFKLGKELRIFSH